VNDCFHGDSRHFQSVNIRLASVAFLILLKFRGHLKKGAIMRWEVSDEQKETIQRGIQTRSTTKSK
jgi:hypothetical protein